MLTLNVNGENWTSTRSTMTPLLDVLRDDLQLTGAKSVCREGFCGACTVHLDGLPAMSCLIPVGSVEGCEIRTIESIAEGGDLSELQQAMVEYDAVQCGMCFPGILMTLTPFLRDRPGATREDIKAALVGNICRCTGYERILEAAESLTRRVRA